ncbi:MAG: hypothetical protein M2R45_01826 [Verrucomicrobia subdivision 3 bacterium]|nr:hypothetical protein [Limisphaerales bacterium]MCS1415819.1 hypothetical protein [Limisphaerales bacterium]
MLRARKSSGRQSRIVSAWSWLDAASGACIYFGAVFAPWAFGTVHPWAIKVMNGVGFVLGVLFLLKTGLARGWVLRSDSEQWNALVEYRDELPRRRRWLMVLAWLMVFLVGYIFLHWINARGTFDPRVMGFIYHEKYLPLFPHSYDQPSTGETFWRFLALALGFWATRDWLKDLPGRFLFRSRGQQLTRWTPYRRMKRLLVVLVVNAMVLALVGILQRLDGNIKLLWIHTPQFPLAESHFGPFAYRGNASTYFNLLWPCCFYLLLCLRQERLRRGRVLRAGRDPHVFFFPGIILLALVPVISTSRAGLLFGCLLGLACLVFGGWRFRAKRFFLMISGVTFIAIVAGAFSLGMARAVERMQLTFTGASSLNGSSGGLGREHIYLDSLPMVRDHLIWGAGPGSFSSIYAVNRGLRYWRHIEPNAPLNDWSAWVHCDPLEFLITFGLVGFVVLSGILFILVFVPVGDDQEDAWVANSGFLRLALGGFCLHSVIDFPFQIYSLLHAFLLVAVVLATLGGKTPMYQRLVP